MHSVLKIILRTPDTRPALVIACMLFASLAEAVGITVLLPILALTSDTSNMPSTAAIGWINGALEAAGFAVSLGSLILLMLAFMVVKSVFAFWATSYAGITGARVAMALRRRLVAAAIDARWAFYANQSTGQFANAVSNDSGRAAEAYLFSAEVLSLILQTAGYAIVALVIDWRLAVAGLFVAALVVLPLNILVRITKRAGYKQTDRTAELTVLMIDMLANIKPLKTMRRHGPMLERISHTLKGLKRVLIRRELAKAGLEQGGSLVAVLLAGAGLYGAHTYWNISLPVLIVNAVVFFQIIVLSSKIQRALQKAAQFESAYHRALRLVEIAESDKEQNTGHVIPQLGRSIRLENVSFSHNELPTLSQVNAEIPARAITVLSGPSGSGKTTLVDLLIGLNRPDDGRVFIDDDPLDTVDLWQWRKRIGYVPQELNLLHTDIRENITLGDRSITDEAVLAALEKAGAAGFVASLPQGLDTDVGEMGAKLSGGQRQRISLARALVTRPLVLILDEVTSALDPATEAEIVSNIAALRGEYTILAITHRSAWTGIADRLYRVSGGKVSPEARAGQNWSASTRQSGSVR